MSPYTFDREQKSLGRALCSIPKNKTTLSLQQAQGAMHHCVYAGLYLTVLKLAHIYMNGQRNLGILYHVILSFMVT